MNALSRINRVPAQMRKAFAGTLLARHAAFAALDSCRFPFDEDSRFSATVLIGMGILSSLTMAFPLFLNLAHRP